jgi:hypothetical protein
LRKQALNMKPILIGLAVHVVVAHPLGLVI